MTVHGHTTGAVGGRVYDVRREAPMACIRRWVGDPPGGLPMGWILSRMVTAAPVESAEMDQLAHRRSALTALPDRPPPALWRPTHRDRRLAGLSPKYGPSGLEALLPRTRDRPGGSARGQRRRQGGRGVLGPLLPAFQFLAHRGWTAGRRLGSAAPGRAPLGRFLSLDGACIPPVPLGPLDGHVIRRDLWRETHA